MGSAVKRPRPAQLGALSPRNRAMPLMELLERIGRLHVGREVAESAGSPGRARRPHGANSLCGKRKIEGDSPCSGAESQSRQRERWVARDGGRVLTPGGGGLRRTGTLGGRHPKGFAPGQGAQGQADSDIQGQGSPQPRRRRRAGGPSVFQRCAHRVL